MDTALRYYHYRSAPKIEMLWEQLDAEAIETYAAELKFNVGFVSGGVSSKTKDLNLHTKLEIVLRHLRKNRKVGCVDSPSVFFKGTIPMTWQPLNFDEGNSDQRLVLFSGHDLERKKLVGLIGSAAHVAGMNNDVPVRTWYASPEYWSRFAENLTPPDEIEVQNQTFGLDAVLKNQSYLMDDGPPKVMLEFVAKTFISKENIVFGSPLYVAELTSIVE